MATKAISPTAKESLDKFLSFVALMTENEWQKYIEAGSLNLKLIASKCGFARSVIYQNKHVIEVIKTTSKQLFEDGLIDRLPYENKPTSEYSGAPKRDRSNRKLNELKEENRQLQNRVAELQAKVTKQKNKIDKYESEQGHLFHTGRLPR